MRKTFKFKRWMAFLLAFILTATTCMSSADAFLWATDTNVEDTAAQPEETKPVEETQVVDLSNPPPSDSNGADDVQAPVEEETPEQVQAPQEESAGEPQDGETADDADETQQTEPGADLPGDDDVMTPAGDDVTEEPKNPETQAPEGEEDSDKISGSSEETADTYSYTIAYFYDDVEDEEARVTKDDGVLGDKILTIEVEEEVTLPDGAHYELKEIVNEDGVITEDGDNKVEIYYESVEGDEDEEADEEETPDDKMPAQTLTGYAGGVKITVDAAEGILPEGTTVEVASVGVEEVQDAINMALEPENLTAVEINAVDITLKKDGESVRPAGSVSVKLENLFSADGHGTVARVYHVSGSSASVVGSADASATNVEFATDHFSVYAGVKAVSGSVMTLEEPGEIKATYTMRVGDTRKLDAETGQRTRDHEYVVDTGLDVAKVKQEWISREANVTALAVGEAFIKYTWTTGSGKKKEEHTEWFKIIVTDEYTIVYDLNDGSGTKPDSVRAKAGEPITLPTGEGISRSEHRLLGWSTQKDANTVNEHGDKITIYSLGGEYVVSGDQTLYAVWAKVEGVTAGKITIGLRNDGTIPDEPSIQNAEYRYLVSGEHVENVLQYFSPAHTVSGVDNVKNVLQPDFYAKVESANANRSFWNPDTEYVEWYVIKYQGNDQAWHIDGVVRQKDLVNLDYNGNGYTAGHVPDGKQYDKGTEVKVSDKATLEKTGYDFKGWNTADDGTGTSYQPEDIITLQESVTLYAQWEPKNSTEYKVEHWQQQLDGTYRKAEEESKKGRTDSKVTANPKNYTGYVYNPDHHDSKAEGVIRADGSLVLKLYYDRATYTVTYDLDGGSSSEQLVYPGLKYGENTPTLKADPEKLGHTFLGWNPTIEPTVTGTVTYSAKWNKIPYSITYQWAPDTPSEVKNKVSVPVDSKEYFYGDSYTISVSSYQSVEIVDEYGNVTDRYTFTGWDKDNGIVTGNIFVIGSWNHSEVLVSEWRITYEWSGEVPEGDYIQEMPVDGKSYKNNEPYTVDTKYSNGYTVPTYDEYGNVNGNYTFSGWDKQDGKMTEDLTVSGTWKFVETDVAKHNVSYTWKGLPEEALYDEAGKVITPVLPDSITGLVKNQEYTVDTTMPGTEVYTHDEFGNKNALYTLGEWQDPNSGKMGDSDVEVSAEWEATPVKVSEWKITYEWSGEVPEGDYIQEMPVDGKSYKNNEPYTVDTKYSNGYTVPTYDEYGNVNGNYTFSGWDKQDGKMTEDLTVSGTWKFVETDVAKHNVSYTWKGLPEEALYDEAGKVITPVLPDSITGLVKNQEYTVDTTMPGTEVYTHDEFGNKNALYKLGEWQDPNSGKMGDNEVVITGEWILESIPVEKYSVQYTYTGNIPQGAEGLLPQTAEYFLNQPVGVADKVHVSGYIFEGWSVSADSNVSVENGRFKMPGHNVTFIGNWVADFGDISATGIADTYDGIEKFVAVTGTREGDQIEYLIDNESVTNSFINATDGELTVVVKVTRGNQEREIPVSVNISPRPIVLRSANLTERYNGSEYTNPKIIDEDKVDWVASDKAGISYVFTGKQKLVGSSDNTFTVESSNGIRLENYDIKMEFGKLTITDGNTTDPINANDVVTKTHAAGTYEVGDRIEFTITVTNIYDTVQTITIKELETVTFEGFGEDVHSVVFNDVEAGGTRTIKAYYTVTEADAYSGTYQNKVEVAFSNGKGYENTDTVTLEKLYRLSVYHLYRNGATAADTMVRYLKAEEGYTHRPPRIAGYRRSTAFITGTMPEKDLDLIVYYTAVETTTDPTPTPTPDPDPTPTPTPDPDPTPTPPTPDPTPIPTPIVEETVPGVPPVPPTPAAVPAGAAPAVVPAGAVPVEAADPGLVAIDDEEVPLAGTLIGEDEDGNITLTPITEEEIPLANRDLDDHKCCALSFLLMLATLIIYTCYTHSMKKRQEKLAELKDQLAEETLKRRLGITNDRKSRM